MANGFEFECAMCHGTFETDRPHEEALAEAKQYYGEIKPDDQAIVCDDCFMKIHPERN